MAVDSRQVFQNPIVANRPTLPRRNEPWRMATWGVLLSAIGLATLSGTFFHTGLGMLAEALIGLVAGIISLALFAGLMWLIGRLTNRLPARFIGAVGTFIGMLLVLKLTVFRWPDELFYPVFFGWIVAQTWLIYGAYGLLAGQYKRLPVWKKVAWISTWVLTAGVCIGGIGWLISDGPVISLPAGVEKVAPSVRPLAIANPGNAGSYAVHTLFYGSGADRRRTWYGRGVSLKTPTVDASLLLPQWTGFKAKMREWYWGFGANHFPLNGQVWYPQGEGPFPLVLIVHGNHSMEEFSEPGYAYLGELLASRGFITVSVDENFVNSTWSGDFMGKEMPVRGWLLLKHLEVWRTWNQTIGNPFYAKVDTAHIALMGHSRGGEAIAIAAAFNRLPYFPDNANVKFNFGFSIRSLVSIAPTDRRYLWRLSLTNVDYLTLQGSYDSDETSPFGLRQARRIAFTDSAYHFKAGLYIHQANHGQFNSIWGRVDVWPPLSWLLNLKSLISGEAQRQVAKTYISAFLEATLHGQASYVPLFANHQVGRHWLPKGVYLSQFQDSDYQAVANYEEDLNLTTATLPGSQAQARYLPTWREEELFYRDGQDPQRNSALCLAWNLTDSANGTTPAYLLTLPINFSTSPDALLSLSISMADPETAFPKPAAEAPKEPTKKDSIDWKKLPPPDFTIELIDNEGRISTLPLSNYACLMPRLEVQYLKLAGISEEIYGKAWEPTFQTVEIPLRDFVKATAVNDIQPSIDLTQLRTIHFRFNRSKVGAILLDDVGFRIPLKEKSVLTARLLENTGNK